MGFLNLFFHSPAGRAALNDIPTGNNPGCGTDEFPALAGGWDPVRVFFTIRREKKVHTN